mgnify:CR=1 FL=1
MLVGDPVPLVAGAHRLFEAGRQANISCACHWTVNVAAAKGHGRIYTDAYSVSPCGIFVPPDSDVKGPEDLADIPISVGYQSGSHYATIQALEQFLPRDQIALTFADGRHLFIGSAGTGKTLLALAAGMHKVFKDERYEKLLVARPMDPAGRTDGAYLVAVDTVDAGVGETVLIVSGSSARMASGLKDCPVDAAIVGVIDQIDVVP